MEYPPSAPRPIPRQHVRRGSEGLGLNPELKHRDPVTPQAGRDRVEVVLVALAHERGPSPVAGALRFTERQMSLQLSRRRKGAAAPLLRGAPCQCRCLASCRSSICPCRLCGGAGCTFLLLATGRASCRGSAGASGVMRTPSPEPGQGLLGAPASVADEPFGHRRDIRLCCPGFACPVSQFSEPLVDRRRPFFEVEAWRP
jgi:hypothetical protein